MNAPAEDNPFTSRRLRPGAVGYVEPTPGLVGALADRFAADPRGQIVGPHGSGKSALLAALVGELRGRGWNIETCELRAGQRRVPDDVWRRWPLAPRGALAIDGFEQLRWTVRWRVLLRSRWRRGGLLLSAHAPIGLPTLHRAAPSLAAAQRVADQLQAGYSKLVTQDDVAQAYAHCGGDLRETLFALYDLYEARRTRH